MGNFSLDTTQLIAMYGAVLATISTILSVALGINEFRKSKKQLKIICEYTRNPLLKDRYSGEDTLDCLFVTVTNVRPRPITVTSIQYKTELGGFQRIELNEDLNIPNLLPLKLGYGASFEAMILLPDIKKAILRGVRFDPQTGVRDNKVVKFAVFDSENRKYVVGRRDGFKHIYAKEITDAT